jgi:hypothetical protein
MSSGEDLRDHQVLLENIASEARLFAKASRQDRQT